MPATRACAATWPPYTRSRAEDSGNSLLANDEPLPTGEEIGQQFEQFLAGLDSQDGNDPTERDA